MYAESFHAQRQALDSLDPLLVVAVGSGTLTLYANKMAILRFDAVEGIPLEEEESPVMKRLATMAPGERREVFDSASGRWYDVRCAVAVWAGVDALLYQCFDVTAYKLREAALERAANTDNLTGLLNRRAYEAALEQAWENCMRAGRPLSMLLFDIDYFKMCNDDYGHMHGDKCLVRVARALKRNIERSGDVLARFGGEEFVALLPETGGENAVAVAQAIRQSVQAMQIAHVEDPSVITRITISAGVSSAIPTKDMLPTQLMLRSDRALYEAKQAGRNRVHYSGIT